MFFWCSRVWPYQCCVYARDRRIKLSRATSMEGCLSWIHSILLFFLSKSINTGRQEIVVESMNHNAKKNHLGVVRKHGGRDMINYLIQLLDVFWNSDGFLFFYDSIFYASHKRDNRADVAMIQSLAWTGGQCLLPMIFWWLREWQYFFLMSTLPLALFLFVPK